MKLLHDLVLKRTSTFTIAIMATVFFYERAVDVGSEKLFEALNKGKLWKDIKHKYE